MLKCDECKVFECDDCDLCGSVMFVCGVCECT